MNYTRTILLIIGLLFAQTATVIHASDHLFHEHSNECASFVAAQHNSAPVLAPGISLDHPITTDEQVSYKKTVTFTGQHTSFHIRAPPAQR